MRLSKAESNHMDSTLLSRRRLMVLGATAAASGIGAATTAVEAGDIAGLVSKDGQEAVLSGRIVRNGHFFTLMSPRGEAMVRVFARDLNRMPSSGVVKVRGRLQVGKFSDVITEQMAYALLLDAVAVS